MANGNIASIEAIAGILQCPRCGSDIAEDRCVNVGCAYAAGFPRWSGQLVLIDFDTSLFSRESFGNGARPAVERPQSRGLARMLHGRNPAGEQAATVMRSHLASLSHRGRLLVVGGGSIGLGAAALYDDGAIEIVGTDVYPSPQTTLMADGHRLPFKGQAFDGVWIQAVLEHVLDPAVVVSEIRRVLKPGGLVYAETPFLQQVHEGAYDFTRFTLSGHRWLFADFTELASGTVAGAGESFAWSARHFLRAIGLPRPVWRLMGAIAAPLRLLDGMGRPRDQADAASCVYFLGRNDGVRLKPQDMLAFYEAQQRPKKKAAWQPGD
jgi:SAM-dependent methyltransferase